MDMLLLARRKAFHAARKSSKRSAGKSSVGIALVLQRFRLLEVVKARFDNIACADRERHPRRGLTAVPHVRCPGYLGGNVSRCSINNGERLPSSAVVCDASRGLPGHPHDQLKSVQRDQVVCNHSAAELDASHFRDRAHHAMGLKADHQLATNLLSTYAHIPATCTNVHQKVSANVHAHRLRWERTRTQAR